MTVHRVFSLLFSPPAQETVRAVRELAKHESVPKLESLRLVCRTDLSELQSEHTRLFVNSWPALPCPPYESFYREGSVYGGAVNEVVAVYQRHGLDYVQEGEPADHISVELDFLARTGSGEFLARMRQWVPKFTARVKKNSTVYEVVARELEDILCRPASVLRRDEITSP